MATEQVTVTRESLYESFRRDAINVSLLLAAAWLWGVFSFFTSTSAGTWFARSGSVMCLIGAVAAFKLINDYSHALATAVENGITQTRRAVRGSGHKALTSIARELNARGCQPIGAGAGLVPSCSGH
jgi:hypothetical protein